MCHLHNRGWGCKKGENVAKQPAKGRKAPSKSRKSAETRQAAAESEGQKKPLIDAIPAEVHKKPAVEKTSPKASVPNIEKPKVAEPAEKSKEQAAVAAPPPSTTPPKKSGFLPLLFGGLIAGGIGFAIANITAPRVDTSLQEQITAQAASISALEAQVSALPVVDLSGIETAQATLTSDIEGLNAQLTDLDDRLTALENLPRGEGTASVPALATYEAEIEALRAQITEMTGIAQTQLDTARAEAAAIEENAAAAARAAAGRAALARLQTGLESGAPLGAALGDLEDALGGPAPDALIAVQDGVPTLAALQEQFPEMARAALATARREGVSGEETAGLGAFLRNQFDVRSVTPQEGTSADAILSRAEAAVREGRLADALAEVSALPEVARAQMSDWLALAETRADAIAAVDILSTSLSDN